MKRKVVFTYLTVDIQSTAGNAFCLLLLFAERWLSEQYDLCPWKTEFCNFFFQRFNMQLRTEAAGTLNSLFAGFYCCFHI